MNPVSQESRLGEALSLNSTYISHLERLKTDHGSLNSTHISRLERQRAEHSPGHGQESQCFRCLLLQLSTALRIALLGRCGVSAGSQAMRAFWAAP